ncbi:hypothetical protein LCGC14_1247860 [marine sediment metagenome]|uniref:Uncharacterized protein n=1 Tax=marine sediment metagenome TaxID=412755 RepID=A0A0F9P7W4_9ZZZZ
MDTEDEVIPYILENTNDPENIAHRIAIRKHNYCKNKNCKYHEIKDE